MRKSLLLTVSFSFLILVAAAQSIQFTVSMENPASHVFHVEMECKGFKGTELELRMPVWTPGYYQRLDFAKNVGKFNATDDKGNPLPMSPPQGNAFKVSLNKNTSLRISYDVLTTRPFVATPYLDEKRGYIVPTGVFLYPVGHLKNKVQVVIKLYADWKNIATGLEPVKGKQNTYTATDYDELYDCPILVGNLEELPPFTVSGIPHRFIGLNLGEFDKVQFMSDLKKIVETGSAIIGHIPYKHYTFIGIGPGQGGIEHSNSTTISFNGSGLASPEGRLRMLNFIAHEHFHHYNVKRIRPIELGPFDYDNGNRTKSLWVSEGLTVYYEYIILKRGGISTGQDLLNNLTSNMRAFETKTGKLYQTLAEASYETWRDGPFGRTNDTVVKTISYYDKGPVVGLLFDFAIRHNTQNKKSLDDVMRRLYREFYQQKKRGFTENELRDVIESTAGVKLDELFDYIYTTKELNYGKYLGYAGLQVDSDFNISRIPNPDQLQAAILKDWLGE
jgi:predicted metalloprotease with PDZ domain